MWNYTLTRFNWNVSGLLNQEAKSFQTTKTTIRHAVGFRQQEAFPRPAHRHSLEFIRLVWPAIDKSSEMCWSWVQCNACGCVVLGYSTQSYYVSTRSISRDVTSVIPFSLLNARCFSFQSSLFFSWISISLRVTLKQVSVLVVGVLLVKTTIDYVYPTRFAALVCIFFRSTREHLNKYKL